MQIFHDPSGDFKIVAEVPLSLFDLARVADSIHFKYLRFVREWPIVTEDTLDPNLWIYWLVSPDLDDSYLDHEVLV